MTLRARMALKVERRPTFTTDLFPNGDFACGHEALDRWLARYAARNQRSDAARTFVAVAPQGRVRGYYTLLAGEVERTEATGAVRRGLSRHFPVPVAILARLAVDRRDQGEGLGAALLGLLFDRGYESVIVRATGFPRQGDS